MENIRENQIGEVLPNQYEPEVGGKGTNISDESDSDRESNSSSSSPRAKKSIKSLKQQMHGAFKLLTGVNVDIAL